MAYRKALLVGIPYLLVVLLLVGCSSPASTSPPTTASPAPPATVASSGATDNFLSGETIKIGLSEPLSGGAAYFGIPGLNAVTLAVDQWNTEGGIFGAKLEVVSIDHEGRPDLGASQMERFGQDQNVLVLVGNGASAVTLAAQAVTNKYSMAHIVDVATNVQITDQNMPNVFRVTGRDDLMGAASALAAKDQGLKNPAVIDNQTGYGRGIADAFSAAWEKLGGKVAKRDAYNTDDKDFRAILRGLPKDADSLFIGGYSTEAALIAQQLREVGSNVTILGGDGLFDVDTFIKGANGTPADGNGAYVVAAMPPPGASPKFDAFKEAFEAKYGPLPPLAPLNYDAALVALNGLKLAAETKGAMPTRQDVVDALTTMPPLQGVTFRDPITWDDLRDNASTGYYVFEATADDLVQTGKFYTAAQIKSALE